MKKIAITFCFIFLGLFSFAQNTTDKALSDNIKVLNSAKTAQDLQNVKNKFTAQIKENSDWKPA
jgi:sensor domain CHASE-containing protein